MELVDTWQSQVTNQHDFLIVYANMEATVFMVVDNRNSSQLVHLSSETIPSCLGHIRGLYYTATWGLQ